MNSNKTMLCLTTCDLNQNEKVHKKYLCENGIEAEDLKCLLHAIEFSSSPILGKPYHKVYYLIDKLINNLIEQKKISEHFGFKFYAINGSNLGEKFWGALLGYSECDIYDDVLNHILTIETISVN